MTIDGCSGKVLMWISLSTGILGETGMSPPIRYLERMGGGIPDYSFPSRKVPQMTYWDDERTEVCEKPAFESDFDNGEVFTLAFDAKLSLNLIEAWILHTFGEASCTRTMIASVERAEIVEFVSTTSLQEVDSKVWVNGELWPGSRCCLLIDLPVHLIHAQHKLMGEGDLHLLRVCSLEGVEHERKAYASLLHLPFQHA
jgi:hypothetical protein